MMDSESNKNEGTVNEQFHIQWTTESQKKLLNHMIRLKPCGINKHLSMLLLQKQLSEDLNIPVSTKCIWKCVNTYWNIEAADKIEGTTFKIDDKNFDLSGEFDQLVAEERDKILDIQERKCLNDEMNKRELFVGHDARASVDLLSSVDSKDGPDEIVPVTLFKKSNVKINDHTSEEAPNSRRSLRSYDKPGENDQGGLLNRNKKVHVNNKSGEPNQSIDLQKCERVPGVSELKSEYSKQNKNEAIHQMKEKARRVTSDQLVILQTPEKPLGRRSCSTKSP